MAGPRFSLLPVWAASPMKPFALRGKAPVCRDCLSPAGGAASSARTSSTKRHLPSWHIRSARHSVSDMQGVGGRERTPLHAATTMSMSGVTADAIRGWRRMRELCDCRSMLTVDRDYQLSSRISLPFWTATFVPLGLMAMLRSSPGTVSQPSGRSHKPAPPLRQSLTTMPPGCGIT